ncbi:pentatricopeptide repeat-containing protein, partial [Trifolium medium]|nr:pentatricopeptide repeat-containing protein [Trifolium medium]
MNYIKPCTRKINNLVTLTVPKPHLHVDASIIKTGFDPNTYRSNFLVSSFLQRGDLKSARKLFDEMPHKNIFSTNTMIMGYIKSGNLSEARTLFDSMFERTAVTWTMLIGGYAQNNRFREAFGLFVEMGRHGIGLDHVSLATLLSGFTEFDSVNEVRQVHVHVVKLGYDSTLVVSNSLLDSYCKTRNLGLACRLFNDIPERDSVTFNALLTGYSKEGFNHEAINLFFKMQEVGYRPTEFTFAAILTAGIQLDDIEFGQQVHGFVVKCNFVWNVFVANALLDFYSKHDRVEEARKLFYEMPEVDGISYNVLVTCYAWNGRVKESLELFRELQFTGFDRRQFPFATLLSIAAISLNLDMGRQIHSQTIVTDAISEILVGNSVVDMYAKCGKFGEANRVFADLAHQSSVPWTAMISAYVQKGLHEDGLKLFIEMQRAKIGADAATYASIVRACASLASLTLGKQLHSHIVGSGYISNVFSGSALVDMYAKCGSIKDALQMFQEMPVRNSVSWNALISAYAQNGDGD